MAKANLILSDGTKVNIEGTVNEVAILLAKFSQPVEMAPSKKRTSRKKRSGDMTKKSGKKRKPGPTGFITELAEEGYFKSKRTLPDIQKKLEERGHIYAQSSLSPILTRLTRKRVIRRLKEKKGWVYVS